MDENAQQITLARTLNAPVAMVWKAWTTPEGWAEWFGKPGEVPKDSVSIDARVGGRWKSTTIAQGQTINFTGAFKEFAEPNKLVMTIDNPDPEDQNNTDVETVTVLLEDTGDNKTEMTFTQAGHLPPEEYQKGLKEGWTGFFDALEKYLASK